MAVDDWLHPVSPPVPEESLVQAVKDEYTAKSIVPPAAMIVEAPVSVALSVTEAPRVIVDRDSEVVTVGDALETVNGSQRLVDPK